MFKPQLFLALLGVILLIALCVGLGVKYSENEAFVIAGALVTYIGYAIKKLSGGNPE